MVEHPFNNADGSICDLNQMVALSEDVANDKVYLGVVMNGFSLV